MRTLMISLALFALTVAAQAQTVDPQQQAIEHKPGAQHDDVQPHQRQRVDAFHTTAVARSTGARRRSHRAGRSGSR